MFFSKKSGALLALMAVSLLLLQAASAENRRLLEKSTGKAQVAILRRRFSSGKTLHHIIGMLRCCECMRPSSDLKRSGMVMCVYAGSRALLQANNNNNNNNGGGAGTLLTSTCDTL